MHQSEEDFAQALYYHYIRDGIVVDAVGEGRNPGDAASTDTAPAGRGCRGY